jgi:hypothetical protein
MPHTPGPWAWTPMSRSDSYQNGSLDAGTRSVVFHSACWWPRKADRTLIAAAPELLEACKVEEYAFRVPAGTRADDELKALELLRAAIAKAEGSK